MATTTSDLPNLSTVVQTNTGGTTATSTTDSSTITSDVSSTTSAATFSSGTTTNTGGATLSDLPTIAGAGIPTMIVPYTANAPFMQKSNLPEGTVFIAVGAVLAFLGACVILWRGLVAWSINRSVRRAALAAIRGSEKNPSTWGGSGSGYAPVKDSLYKDAGYNMSMDALNHAGKPIKGQHRDGESRREATPPAGLFFSPTAQAGPGGAPQSRASSYLPAGYYASPSAQAAGGAGTTTIGNSLAPYARQSVMTPSPPASPNLRPTTRGSTYRATSRDTRGPPSRDGVGSARQSYLDPAPRHASSSGVYSHASTSSLAVGTGVRNQSNDNLAGSRAPSAYLDDLFENHGNGPRERH